MTIALILLLAIILALFIINHLLKRTWWYRNLFVDARKFTEGIPNNLQIVNLGSSQPKFAFDYQDTAWKGMNMALAPQPFLYDYRILKQYASHLCKGAFVLIPVCPFKFFVYKYANDAINRKYYPFLQPESIDGYSRWKKCKILRFPVLMAGKRILKIIKDDKRDSRMDLENNPMNQEQRKADAGKWVDGWKKQFSLDDLDHIDLSKKNQESIDKNISIVKKILALCREKELRPVFILLPVTRELGVFFPDSYLAEYVIGNIERCKADHEPVLNFFRDDQYSDAELYINSFFFNKKGRKLFTKQLIKRLGEL